MVEAVIFDVDGTLVDSVDLHAKAWMEAFAHFGKRVGFKAVRSQIGKGGDQLMPVFLTKAELSKFGEQLEKWRTDFFMRTELPRVQPFPRVRALFQALRDRGLKTVLATSGKKAQLEHHMKLCNISDLVDEATHAEDADRTKPHPDIFVAAMNKVGLSDPSRFIVVGDTPYDAIAAHRAGLRTIGVLCGGFPAEDLRQSGVVALYEDPADLLDHLETSPILSGREADRADA